MIQSPLNYTGGKFKLLPQILPLFPKNINTFVDLFCGGCNVGINVDSNRVIYNDLNENLLCLYNTFKNRLSGTLDFKTAKIVLNFLQEKMLTINNISTQTPFVISFYGGEPLLNINLSRAIIQNISPL